MIFVVLLTGQAANAQVGEETQIAFLSDTQDPTWIERFFLKLNRNGDARNLIFQDILSGTSRAVVHLGDMVSSGSRDGAWAPIDGLVDSLHSRGRALHPTPGNHEYFFFPNAGIRNFKNRFPDVNLAGYSLRFDGLAVVLLNSNFSRLTAEERQYQSVWYRETLHRLDADTTVEFVIVGCHHSPFTNSTIVSPSEDVESTFVPPFVAARKTVLFLSGHAHAFEHYQRSGKDFLVIGGGGGLQQPLLTGSKRRYEDLYPDEGTIRMFHYLLCTVGRGRLQIELRMLREDFSGFDHTAVLEFNGGKGQPEVAEKKKTPLP